MAKAAWLAGEAAILATALAELVGGAIALRLLFGLPLLGGVAVTGVGTFAVLALTRGNADRHERVIAVLLAIVAASFVFLLFKANPAWIEVAQGVARTGGALRDPQGFLIALGILGATLMPHNLYLHSGSLAERARSLPADARDIAMRVARNDTALSLGVAMLINAAIMIVAAASCPAPASSSPAWTTPTRPSATRWARAQPSSSRWRCMPRGKAPPSPGCWPAASCRAASRPAVTGPIVAARWPPG